MLKGFHRAGLRDNRAFTMLEVIAVLILIGILTGVATVTLFSTDDYTTTSQLAMVKAHLRYAQARAIHSGSTWGVKFAAAKTSYDGRLYSKYWLFIDPVEGSPIVLQGADDSRYVVVFGDGSVGVWPLDITPPSGLTVKFDKWGSPGPANVTISTDAGTISVTKNTGYID